MTKHRVVVSFTTYVNAKDTAEVDDQINNLLNSLGEVETSLSWDDCEWETYFVLEDEEN